MRSSTAARRCCHDMTRHGCWDTVTSMVAGTRSPVWLLGHGHLYGCWDAGTSSPLWRPGPASPWRPVPRSCPGTRKRRLGTGLCTFPGNRSRRLATGLRGSSRRSVLWGSTRGLKPHRSEVAHKHQNDPLVATRAPRERRPDGLLSGDQVWDARFVHERLRNKYRIINTRY